MAEETVIPYEVAFVYDCQCCKKSHTEFGQIKQPGVAVTHREELKWRLLELVKEKFSKAHPKEKFDLDNLTVEEFVDGNKAEVNPQTIQPREVKGEDLTKPRPKKGERKVLQIEKILPPVITTNIAGIKKMLDDRMAEIRKREKEIDEQVKKLTGDLETMSTELAELERLQTAAEEIVATKSTKEKDKK